jgi:hypothetical protein
MHCTMRLTTENIASGRDVVSTVCGRGSTPQEAAHKSRRMHTPRTQQHVANKVSEGTTAGADSGRGSDDPGNPHTH